MGLDIEGGGSSTPHRCVPYHLLSNKPTQSKREVHLINKFRDRCQAFSDKFIGGKRR